MNQLKILSYNVNGVRSAESKGLSQWLKTVDADIVCLQEIKVSRIDFSDVPFKALGYECYIFPAEKKGYSGVAIFTKLKPDNVVEGIGLPQYDAEGRNLRLDFGDLSVMSAYFPSGTTGDERQDVKMRYLEDIYTYLQTLQKERSKLIVAGDYNICHTAIDIHDPVRNKDVSGFKPEERAWMEKFFTTGFTDSFRFLHPTDLHQYSWWSYRANARANNKGWRIDYIAATDNLRNHIAEAQILQDAKHSDHCPVLCKLNM
ncbi:MAG: exodeoxyribonuclease III [Chitinophagales bacterium]